jgi:hypothetical protein
MKEHEAKLGQLVKKEHAGHAHYRHDLYKIIALYRRGDALVACLERADGPKLKEPLLAEVSILDEVPE